VRELEHEIEKAVTLSSGNLITESFIHKKKTKEHFAFEPKEGTLKDTVEALEKEMIKKALQKYKYQKDAAKALGLSPFGFRKKLKRYNIN
jgi:transcriptional regulator with PAS, ATPase and Fis domain